MKLFEFSIFDSKAKAFLDPYLAITQAVGIRRFKKACMNEGSDFNNFPGDYTLFEIGMFDNEVAKHEQHESKINHGLAILHIDYTVDDQPTPIFDAPMTGRPVAHLDPERKTS